MLKVRRKDKYKAKVRFQKMKVKFEHRLMYLNESVRVIPYSCINAKDRCCLFKKSITDIEQEYKKLINGEPIIYSPRELAKYEASNLIQYRRFKYESNYWAYYLY